MSADLRAGERLAQAQRNLEREQAWAHTLRIIAAIASGLALIGGGIAAANAIGASMQRVADQYEAALTRCTYFGEDA